MRAGKRQFRVVLFGRGKSRIELAIYERLPSAKMRLRGCACVLL